MAPTHLDRPAGPDPPDPSTDALDALRARCRVHQAQLVKLASCADTLVEAARLVDDACTDAEQLVAAARRQADVVCAEAAETAAKASADARRQIDVLRSEIVHLQAEREQAEAALRAALARVEGVKAEDARLDLANKVPPATYEAPGGAARSVVTLPHGGLLDADLEPVGEPADEGDLANPADGSVRRWGRRAALAAGVVAVLAASAWMFRGRDVTSSPAPPAAAAQPAGPSNAIAEPTPGTAEASPPPAAEPQRVAVAIRAARKAWLRLGIDGALQPGGFIDAGEQRTLAGDREVEIRTADAGALLVSLNGGAEAPLGSNGAVLTRRWVHDGSKSGAGTPSVVVISEPRSAAAGETPPPPAPSEQSRPEPAPAATGGEEPPGSTRQQIIDAERRWFDAQYRRDEQALQSLQAPGFELVDLRPVADRPAPGVPVERIVRAVQIDTWADGAVVSGQMSERQASGDGREVVSLFAGTWVRREGRWQLLGLRLSPPAKGQTPDGR